MTPLSIVIPTYAREQVLCETIRYLLDSVSTEDEILVVDQTLQHEKETDNLLKGWDRKGLETGLVSTRRSGSHRI